MAVFDNWLELDSLTTLDWVAIHLVLATGIIHIVIGVRFIPQRVPVLILLSGLGFFGALILFLADYRRTDLYLAGIPYTAANIVAWVLITRPSGIAGLRMAEVFDKVVQLLLIVVLVLLYSWES